MNTKRRDKSSKNILWGLKAYRSIFFYFISEGKGDKNLNWI